MPRFVLESSLSVCGGKCVIPSLFSAAWKGRPCDRSNICLRIWPHTLQIGERKQANASEEPDGQIFAQRVSKAS
jgi:hypothetical protein